MSKEELRLRTILLMTILIIGGLWLRLSVAEMIFWIGYISLLMVTDYLHYLKKIKDSTGLILGIVFIGIGIDTIIEHGLTNLTSGVIFIIVGTYRTTREIFKMIHDDSKTDTEEEKDL